MQELALCAPAALASHRSYIYRYALARLRQPEVAEELVQETLLAAIEAKAPFMGGSKLRTWLMGILKHKIIDLHRRESRNPARPGARTPAEGEEPGDVPCDALFDSAGNWVTPPSAWPNPEQAMENRQFWETIEECMADMPPATARAFYLREVQGLSTGEICAELDITESNCWVMLHRARLNLRQALEERWFQSGSTPNPRPSGVASRRRGNAEERSLAH